MTSFPRDWPGSQETDVLSKRVTCVSREWHDSQQSDTIPTSVKWFPCYSWIYQCPHGYGCVVNYACLHTQMWAIVRTRAVKMVCRLFWTNASSSSNLMSGTVDSSELSVVSQCFRLMTSAHRKSSAHRSHGTRRSTFSFPAIAYMPHHLGMASNNIHARPLKILRLSYLNDTHKTWRLGHDPCILLSAILSSNVCSSECNNLMYG